MDDFEACIAHLRLPITPTAARPGRPPPLERLYAAARARQPGAVVGDDDNRPAPRAMLPLGALQAAMARASNWAQILRRLDRELAHPMCEATFPRRRSQADLERLDDAGSTVANQQERVAETACPHVLAERRDHRGILRIPPVGAAAQQLVAKGVL